MKSPSFQQQKQFPLFTFGICHNSFSLLHSFIYTRDLKLWMFMMCIPAVSFRLPRFILQITISKYSLLNNEVFKHFKIWTFASKNLDDKVSLSNFQWSSDLPAVWQTCFQGTVIITKLGRVSFVLYACTCFQDSNWDLWFWESLFFAELQGFEAVNVHFFPVRKLFGSPVSLVLFLNSTIYCKCYVCLMVSTLLFLGILFACS